MTIKLKKRVLLQLLKNIYIIIIFKNREKLCGNQ